MSVLRDVHSPDRGSQRRRRVTLAAAAALAVLSAAACGVQPTGLHVSVAQPVTLDTPQPSSSSSDPSAGQYAYWVFLYQGPVGSIKAVQRTADHVLTPFELVNALGAVDDDERAGGYTTRVPDGLGDMLSKTKEKHAYSIGEQVSSTALTQMVCTLDLYWVQNPDADSSIQPSTKFVGPGITNPLWDDCSRLSEFSQAAAYVRGKIDPMLTTMGPAVSNKVTTGASTTAP